MIVWHWLVLTLIGRKFGDNCLVNATFKTLLDSTMDAKSRARLLAASTKEVGAWLNVQPISSLTLRMDDVTVRVAVGLRLGTSLCHPHTCQHCGAEVDCYGLHLSCKWSQGHHHRHTAINSIVHKLLAAAQVPSRLEPSGFSRSDGKRPDGITVVPWKSGRMMIWGVTCPDTFAVSYQSLATTEADMVAARAEENKKIKYLNLDTCYIFASIAIEASGVVGAETMALLCEIGHQLRETTMDDMAFTHFLQQLSVAVQQGNAASIVGNVVIINSNNSRFTFFIVSLSC